MCVIEAGEHKHIAAEVVQVANDGLRPCQMGDLVARAHRQHLAAADGHSLNHLRFILGKPSACIDDSVEKDDLRYGVA